jgi:hypothetical protein
MGYWITSLALIAFGLVAGMSIGLPFFVIGAAMVALGRFRRHALVFWPLFLGFAASVIAYFAITSFSCSGSSSTSGGLTTTCTSLVGISWPAASNGLAASPIAFYLSILAALIVGVATVALVLGWLWLDRNRKQARQTG